MKSTLFLPMCVALVILCFSYSESEELKRRRVKRKVVFSKSSKFFFRLNGKDNMLNYTEIFAHGWSFRMNYDLPENILRRRKFFKRDVSAELEGATREQTRIYSCVLKYVCQVVTDLNLAENCGVLCGIGNIIAESQGIEAGFFKSIVRDCDFHINNCPYLLMSDQYVTNYG